MVNGLLSQTIAMAIGTLNRSIRVTDSTPNIWNGIGIKPQNSPINMYELIRNRLFLIPQILDINYGGGRRIDFYLKAKDFYDKRAS